MKEMEHSKIRGCLAVEFTDEGMTKEEIYKMKDTNRNKLIKRFLSDLNNNVKMSVYFTEEKKSEYRFVPSVSTYKFIDVYYVRLHWKKEKREDIQP